MDSDWFASISRLADGLIGFCFCLQHLEYFDGSLQHMVCHPIQELTCRKCMKCWRVDTECLPQRAALKRSMK